MAFEPQNAFERSLVRAATDPAHRPQFYKDLLEADFLVIQEGPLPDRTEETVLKADRQLQIKSIDWKGKAYIPVFSSLSRLQAVLRSETGYIALNALEFMKITRGADLILNPGSEYGKEFPKEEVESIIDGSIWQPDEKHTTKKNTKVLLGQPARYPKDLVDALSRYFKNTKEVKKAYLAHLFNPSHDEKGHTVIGIEVSGNWENVIGGAGIIVQNVVVPDPPVDFIQITGKEGIEEYFVRDSKPFYTRKVFGLF